MATFKLHLITAIFLTWLQPVVGDVPTIHRDVAIIGGGAAGGYSAARLREDYNLSVVLIEKSPTLVRSIYPWLNRSSHPGRD